MIEVSWNWSCLALHINKAKGRIFCAMNIRSPYLTLSINHSFGMIYHYMFYMYTCKHHSQVFISSSSFRRNPILRFIVCGQNPLKHLKGQTIVLLTLRLCAHIPHSYLPW